MSGLLASNSSTALNSVPTKLAQLPPLLNFSPDFVGWCANCDTAFHHFEPGRCVFIYQAIKSQTETEAKVIIGFYCPSCDEALAQAQPNFATEHQQNEVDPAFTATAATEWRYPTDEELEDALEWSIARG
jgi:hypothetical protein